MPFGGAVALRQLEVLVLIALLVQAAAEVGRWPQQLRQ
jgi:hypothetical protein